MRFAVLAFLLFSVAAIQAVRAEAPVVAPPTGADYYVEPVNQPYDEEIQAQKQEDGWHWMEFRFTSQVYNGEPMRFHAVYGVPDNATKNNKVPAILMTHGIFGAILGDKRYWNAYSRNVKAGYAVLFLDWYPDFAHNFVPKDPNEPKHFTTYGSLDYFKPYYSYNKEKNDFKDSLQYQVVIAAKRALTWLQARPEVDGTRIGATGASYGGIFSAMFAGLDSRISAVNCCVFTGGFGPKERGYNALGYTGQTLDTWRERYDPQILLAKRQVAVLYTVGANDGTFLLTKAVDNYATMLGPKRLLIGPNSGHEYWAAEQTPLFFDATLKNKFTWPAADSLMVKNEGGQLVASVKVTGDAPRKVEFFYAPIFEIDPDKLPSTIFADAWKWIGVEAKETQNLYTLKWAPTAMRPINPQEHVYYFGSLDILDPKTPPVPEPIPDEMLTGLVRVFARVTDAHGAMACTPISTAITISDPPGMAPLIKHNLPALDAAFRVKTNMTIAIDSTVPDGQPAATLDLPLPVKAVGTKGYCVWNWRGNRLSSALMADGVITPTKKLLPPFADTISLQSFIGGTPWQTLNRGGLIACAINGKPDELDANKRAYHGSISPYSEYEDLPLDPGDTAVHRLTLVMAGGGQKECNLRVSLIAADGATETVAYRHQPASDCVLQFRFTGKVTLRIKVTARVLENTPYTQVGPTAIFLD